MGDPGSKSAAASTGVLEKATSPSRSSSATRSAFALPPERLDHLLDERPVVLQHLVFERRSDELALRPRGLAGALEQAREWRTE